MCDLGRSHLALMGVWSGPLREKRARAMAGGALQDTRACCVRMLAPGMTGRRVRIPRRALMSASCLDLDNV